MMESWRLHDPLLLLAALPLVLLCVHAARRARRHAVPFSSLVPFRGLPVTAMTRARRILPFVRALGLVLLVVALARPQKGREEFRVRAEGIAIELVLDRSGSMLAMDFEDGGRRVNRLDVVKRVVRDFVDGGSGLRGRPDDRLGLVVFGGFAEGRCPLTLDHGALLSILDGVEVPQPLRDAQGRVVAEDFLQMERATAIGDALALGVERVKDAKGKSRILILLSDGESNAGALSPDEAAAIAKATGVKVYTIGVGKTGVAPFPGEDAFGRPVLVRQPVRLDEETLRRVAATTGGQYFNAQDTRALQNVYATIDKLERTEVEGQVFTEYRERFLPVLLAGAGLLLVEWVLRMTRMRVLP